MKKRWKISAALIAVLSLSACGSSESSATVTATTETAAVETANATTEPAASAAASSDADTTSDSLTDYDKAAVTAYINKKLKDSYSRGSAAVDKDKVEFTKKGNRITATGVYTGTDGNNYDFTFVYEKNGDTYTLISSEAGDQAAAGSTPSTTSSTSPDASYSVDESYDIRVSSGVTVTLSYQGTGNYLVEVLDSSGSVVSTVFSGTGSVSDTKTASLSAGNYTLRLRLSDGGYSMNYSCN